MQVSWPTVALAAVVGGTLTALVAFHVSPEVIAAIGGLGTAAAAVMESAFKTRGAS